MRKHRQAAKSALKNGWKKYLFLAGIVCLAGAARLIPGPRVIDDAFITYRYARNILAGTGFLYNPGEAIQGTTTPLYTLLLALIGSVSGGTDANFPQIAFWINTAADTLTCLLILEMGRRLKYNYAGAAAALTWAVAPYSVTFAIGGLETSIYVLLLTLTVYFYLRKQSAAAAFTAALSILTRPDAVLLAGMLIIERFRQFFLGDRDHKPDKNLKFLLRDVLVFTIPGGIWAVYALFRFGSLIPHSVLAKQNAYLLPKQAALVRFLQHFGTPFFEHLCLTTSWIWIALFLYPFLFIIGARESFRQKNRVWPWIVYPWLYTLVFSIANPLIFRWYLTPPLLPYIFFIFAGLETFLERILKDRTTVIRRLAAGVLLFLLPLGSSLQAWEVSPDHGPARPAPEMAFIKLETLYHRAADKILHDLENSTAANSLQSPVLAAGDVGVLGYETELPILDTVGLNSDQSLKYYPLPEDRYVINYALPDNLILDEQPDYLVILEVYGRKTLLENPDFLSAYQLLDLIPTDIYGSRGMLIYKQIQ